MKWRVLVFLIAPGIGACSTSATAPSGPCAADERTASALYGPPLSVHVRGDTTTYTWGVGSETFVASGSTCTEHFRS